MVIASHPLFRSLPGRSIAEPKINRSAPCVEHGKRAITLSATQESCVQYDVRIFASRRTGRSMSSIRMIIEERRIGARRPSAQSVLLVSWMK